jgi:hypothetical protein
MCLTCHSRLTSRKTIYIDTIFEVGMIATIKEVISRKRSLHKLTFDNSYRSRSVNPQGLGVWSNCVKEEMGKWVPPLSVLSLELELHLKLDISLQTCKAKDTKLD